MAFIKRLGYYLVGFSIGVVLLTFFFKNKTKGTTDAYFCYFPNCRTLKDIRNKPLSYSAEISQLLNDKKLDSTIINSFFTEGDVDFGRSETKTTPCKTYLIEHEINEKVVTLQVKNCPSEATLETISL